MISCIHSISIILITATLLGVLPRLHAEEFVKDISSNLIGLPPAAGPLSLAAKTLSSDDCNIVVSAREDRPLLVLHPGGPQSTVRAIEFSPDSQRMYSAGLDKAVHTWGFQIEERGIKRAGRLRAILAQTLRWELERGPNGQIFGLAASPVGRQLAVAGFNARVTERKVGGDIVIYDTARGEVERVLQGHTAPVVSITYSPNGKRIVSAARHGEIILWKEETQWSAEILREAGDDVGVFLPVAFLDDKRVLFPSRGDKKNEWKLAMADVDQPKNPPTIFPTVHANALTCIAIDRPHQRLATADLVADGKGTLYLWSTQAEITAEPVRRGRLPLAMDFDPLGRLFVATALFSYADGSQQSTLEMWDTNLGKMTDQVEVSPQEHASACRVSPDGSKVVTYAGHAGELRVYNLKQADGSPIEKPLSVQPLRLKGHGQNIVKVAFEKGGQPGTYRLGYGTVYSPKRDSDDLGSVSQGFDLSQVRPMNPVDVSKTSWRTAAEGVKGWSASIKSLGTKVTIKNGEEIWTEIECSPQQQGLARSFAFLTTPGSTQPYGIAVGTVVQDRILVYLIRKKDEPAKLVRYFRDHAGFITSLSVSEDGKYLASGSIDQTIKIWSLEGIKTTETRFGPAAAWGASFLFEDGKIVARGVLDSGTAARKGIREGDVITKARFVPSLQKQLGAKEDQPVTDPRSILRGLESAPLTELCLLTLERRGSAMNRDILMMPAWSPVITLFVDDRGEWAAFTPQGYYDASVAGDEMFGWQINRGSSRRPDFFRADQFRQQLERPKAIQQLLAVGSIQQALRLVDEVPDAVDPVGDAARATPRITILSPTDNQELVDSKVPLLARVEYAEPQQVDRAGGSAFVNGVPGKLVSDQKDGLSRTFEWSADVYDTYNRLKVVSANDQAEPLAFADVNFRVRGADPSRRPRIHRFMLAASKYQHVPVLDFPVKDAQAIADILGRQTGAFYEPGLLKEIYDENLTRESVQVAIDEWKKELADARPDDLLVVFIAGHGLAQGNAYYFVPVSTKGPESLSETGIGWNLLAQLADVGCKKLVLLDTCHSGNILPVRDAGSENWKQAIRPLKQTEMMIVTATDIGQEALEIAALGHGVFTQAILDGLGGAADRQKDQDIYLQEVTEWVEAEVPKRTKDLQLQTPRSYPTQLLNAVSVPLVSLR
jgi:WD40 repeat protein